MHATTTFELWRFISICSKFVFPRLLRRTCTEIPTQILHAYRLKCDFTWIRVNWMWKYGTITQKGIFFFTVATVSFSFIYVLPSSVVAIIAHGNGFVSQLEDFFPSQKHFNLYGNHSNACSGKCWGCRFLLNWWGRIQGADEHDKI